jgi:hypothetical protein
MRDMIPKVGRLIAAAALATGLGQPAVARAEATWEADPDDALLLDVRLGQLRLGDGIRGYQTPNGPCLDFADTIMALDLPIRMDKKLRRATGWALVEERTITLDREANTVQIMNKTSQLAPVSIADTPEGWCVNQDQLSRWLGMSFVVDTANAILLIKSDTKLPVEMAAERKARAARVNTGAFFDLKSLPHSKSPFKGFKPPAVDVVLNAGGLRQRSGMGYSLSYEAYIAGEAGPVAYEARLASNGKAVPETLRIRAYRKDPDANLLGPLKATQVAAGDVSSFSTALVANSSIGRGASITNRPLERPQDFDRTDFRGELPAGWDAELYRNGELLAFAIDRSDGRYEFLDVPLRYGRNRFEVVLYGPQGQIRRENQTISVGLESIPPQSTWYSAAINQENRDLIDLRQIRPIGGGWRGSVGVERGLNRLTSVAFSLHSLDYDKVGRRNFLEASIRRAIGPALLEVSGSSDLRGGYAGRIQVLGEFGQTSIGLESINAFGGYRSDRIASNVTGQHSLSAYQALSFGRFYLPVSVSARYLTRSDGTARLDFDGRLSANISRINLSGKLTVRQEKRPVGPEPPATIDTALLMSARVGRVRLRGEAKYRLKPDQAFESATLVAEWGERSTNKHVSSWRAELGYNALSHRGHAGLGYVRRFDKFAVTASAEAGTDGTLAAGLNLAFSLGPDPRTGGGIRLSSGHLAAQGQAMVRVFRDMNADGVYQTGEPLEKDVELTAGRASVDGKTDANGEFIIEDLATFQPIMIGIDVSSLSDPLVQPTLPGIVITPRPGVPFIINLPLVSSGEVDGTLVRAGGGSLQGVDLELVNHSGIILKRVQTDFDGYFLFDSVPYGKYTIRLAKLSADAVGLMEALKTQIEINDAVPSLHLETIAARDSGTKSASGP